MCGFIAQLVEHRTGIAEVTGSKPVEALIFSGFFFPIAQIGKFTATITFHFHLQPQYKYELFHINFTSCHCTGRYELNKLTSLPMCGFIAQLVEHRTGIAEVTGSKPVEALIFSGFFFPIAQIGKFTATITFHFHLQPQYKYELFHINFTSCHCTGRYELNKLTSLPMCGFIAQLVEHRTGIAEVTGSKPVEALIFSGFFFPIAQIGKFTATITFHFHLQPQYKYELFHINFTSCHCTGRYELNKLTSLPMCGFIAQLVEHRTGIAEVTGSKPVEALIFSGFFFPIAQIGKFTATITFHFHLQPQYKYELFHINFTSCHCTGRYELNKLTSLPMCGFIAQLVEHRTGIAEVTGSKPVEALIFSGFFFPIAQIGKFTATITFHFHLQPQYKYELFHINFTSCHCTGRYELNKLTSLPMCGFIAQLVEHRTGIAEVTGSKPVEALIFSGFFFPIAQIGKFTATITFHFHLQPQYKYELFHINFTSCHCTGRYELNKLTSLPMCGFIAQLVEHRTGIAEVTGSKPVEALIFSGFFFPIAQIEKFTATITFHFHLQPQYKYELFHINFTSCHCTGRYELNKLTSLPMCGFIAQLVEHRTGIAEVTGSKPVEALIFSGFFFPIAQIGKFTATITFHFHLQPQYKYELFHINFTSCHCTGRYELNKLTSLPMCGFIAQLVEHRTGIAEVTGSKPVEALIFSGFFFPIAQIGKFTATITFHFHLQPQYKYELFHINFTSCHCTGRYELNKLTSLPMCGFIAQLVEHRTGIAEVTGSKPVEALIFSGFFFPIAQIGKFTATITFHFHLQPQYKYELFHINFT